MMSSLLREGKKGIAFVLSGPAGTGKTTLVNKLAEEFPEVILNISYTTRLPRVGEVEGRDYHFITEEQFKHKKEAGDFLESVTLYGRSYGSSQAWIKEQQRLGKYPFLVIDTQGALQLKGIFPAVFIFVRPPSLEVLKERLIKRNSETEEMILKRLKWAEGELLEAGKYDYQIVNDDLESAYHVLRCILIAECHKNLP